MAFHFALCLSLMASAVTAVDIDFSNAVTDPQTGKLCVTQQICIADVEALSRALPEKPCIPPESEFGRGSGCNCNSDADCGSTDISRCVNCVCMECPASVRSSEVFNPPLTFVVDTTKSVRPDKYSIFNLTQKVVDTILGLDINIPQYRLVTFNDFGQNDPRNADLRLETQDVTQFRQEIIGLEFESFDGGRDSKERMMVGLMRAVETTLPRSLVVVFTDNGSKDLELRDQILRMKQEKELEIFIVLTPIYEGFPNDPSLDVYDSLGTVFYISDVGADSLLMRVEDFEESNCI